MYIIVYSAYVLLVLKLIFCYPFIAESLPNWLYLNILGGDVEFREIKLRFNPSLLFSLFFGVGKLQRSATVISCYNGYHSPLYKD